MSKSRQTASKENCKRTAFAEIVRSGHSKQIGHAVSSAKHEVRQHHLFCVDRTTKKKARTFRAFSFSADTEACVRYFARRIFAQLGLRPTDRKQRETQAQSICGHQAQRT